MNSGTSKRSTVEEVRAVLRRWKLLVVVPTVAGLLALGMTFLVSPVYTARTSLLPPQQQSMANAALASLGNLAALSGGLIATRTPADQYIALMLSTTSLDRLIEQFDLVRVYRVDYVMDARRKLEDNTRITAGKRDGLINVEVDDQDPKRSADLANAFVAELRRLSSTLAVSEAQQRRLFFETLLESTRDKLTEAQTALQDSGVNPSVLRIEPRTTAEAIARLQAQATATEVRLQALRQQLSASTPEVQMAEATLAALRAQLRQQEAAGHATQASDYIGRYREYRYQETLFEMFARQYELARVDESREGPLIQVVDPARPPERRSWPRRTVTAIAAAAGSLVLTVLLLMLLGPRRPPPQVHTSDEA